MPFLSCAATCECFPIVRFAILAAAMLFADRLAAASAARPPEVREFPPGLFETMTRGDLDKLKRSLDEDPTLLRAHLTLGWKRDDGRGMTLLHEAAVWGQLNLIEELIRRGSDVNSRLAGNEEEGWFGATPLHAAAVRGRAHVVPFLLKSGARIDAKDAEGNTPMHRALERGFRRTARVLAVQGSPQDVFAAAGLGNLTLLERLLAEDPGLANARTGGGTTPLHFAASTGEVAAAKLLMERGAAIDAMESPSWAGEGNTPLHQACRYGHPEMCAYLIETGADLEKEGRGWTPLHWAIVGGQSDVVELLIDCRADLHHRARGDSSTPLHTAALFGLVDIADLLLKHGARINCPGGDYRDIPNYALAARESPRPTPLDRAVSNGKSDMVRFLVSRGGQVRRESPEHLEKILRK